MPVKYFDSTRAWMGPDKADRIPNPSGMIISGDMGYQIGSNVYSPRYYSWYGLGVRSTNTSGTGTSSPLAHNGNPRVLYLDGAASGAPEAFKAMHLTSSISMTNLANPVVQAAARYFHPFAPSDWAY